MLIRILAILFAFNAIACISLNKPHHYIRSFSDVSMNYDLEQDLEKDFEVSDCAETSIFEFVALYVPAERIQNSFEKTLIEHQSVPISENFKRHFNLPPPSLS